MARKRWPIQGTAGHAIDFCMRYYLDNNEQVPDQPAQRRPCARCGLPPTETGDDPCIANLPGVIYACCGHGGYGYVTFDDRRCIRFTNQSGEAIRAVVMRVLNGFDELPPGWRYDDQSDPAD
jgi:hypothetical protein